MKALSSILLAISLVITVGNLVTAGDGDMELIERAYSKGDIDFRTALNYRLYALFNRNKLPLIMEARENTHLLNKDNEFILQRPTDSGDLYYYGSGVTVTSYDSPGGNFRIHYTEDNTKGDAVYGYDGDYGTIPQYVSDLASYLDASWAKVISDMGYNAPDGDGGLGGDNRVDVYLLDMNSYGYTAYDTNPSDVYIAIENDFTGFPENTDTDSRQGAQKVTAAHEFFHASQFQYTANLSDIWWFEASSTWMEDVVFTDVNDYRNYLGRKYDDSNDDGQWDPGEQFYWIDGITVSGTTSRPTGWFDHPEYSLDSTTGTHEYGGSIWVTFLYETYGNNIIRSVWERIQLGEPVFSAVSSELSSSGTTLADTFSSFQSANYRGEYREGSTFRFPGMRPPTPPTLRRYHPRWITWLPATTPSRLE